MASIFDMFGGSPQSQGLLAAAAQILQASGPSRTPTSLGQILGGGLSAYQQTEQQARQLGQLEQMRGLQIKNAESDLAAQEAQRERAQNLLRLTSQYGQSRGGGQQQSAPPMDRSANAMFQGLMSGSDPSITTPGAPMAGSGMAAPGSPPSGAAGGRNALVQDRLKYAQFLRDNGYTAEANAAEDQALKLQPKVSGWKEVQQDGKAMFAPFFEDGTNGPPVPLEVAKELQRVDAGGTTELLNPFTGASVRSIRNTASPDAVLSAQVQRENSLRQDARAREANANSRGLMNEERQLRIDAMRGKAEDRQLQKQGTVSNLLTQVAVIDKALLHPGRAAATGASSVLDPRNFIPGTDATDFRVVADQLSGGAFLQAFESLKGAGQITEIEGQKATQAIARLNRAQSDAEYQTALLDLREVINAGVERMGGTPMPLPEGFGSKPAANPQPRSNGGGQLKSAMKGQVMDGYRFKGGNPADPNAWEKL